MKQQLLAALLEKKALASDTIITASYETSDLFGRNFVKTGDFKIKRILKSQESCLFELIALKEATNDTIKTPIENIKAIDGMNLDRFADIYDLFPDGTKKKMGRKRGRKPKSQLTA
jgi:hypothetical protein